MSVVVRWICALMCAVIFVVFVGCEGSFTTVTEISDVTQVKTETSINNTSVSEVTDVTQNNTTSSEAESQESLTEATTQYVIIDTEFYTLSVPEECYSECFYEVTDGDNNSYTLSFFHKASYDSGNGGKLFSIMLLPSYEDYLEYPDYEVLGSLDVYRIGRYNIVAAFPTDAQTSSEMMDEYNKLNAFVPDIIDSINYKDECIHSEVPIPVSVPIETSPPIVGNFIGCWHDLGIASPAPSGALSWTIDFRSNGTGTMVLFFDANDTVPIDFTYTPYDTGFGDNFDGIHVNVNGGVDIRYMMTYSWNNQLQKMTMTMYEVTNAGAPDLNACWVFEYI